MSMKYFLRGLGFGILLTAIIMSIAYRSQESAPNIVEEAKKLGMVFPQGTREPAATGTAVSEMTPSAQKEKASQEPSETMTLETDTKKTSEAVTQDTGLKKASAKKQTLKKTKKREQKQKAGYVTITVSDGETSRKVAEKLKAAGVMKTCTEFDHYMRDNNYSRYVRSGTFQIPKGASFEEIARILMKRG